MNWLEPTYCKPALLSKACETYFNSYIYFEEHFDLHIESFEDNFLIVSLDKFGIWFLVEQNCHENLKLVIVPWELVLPKVKGAKKHQAWKMSEAPGAQPVLYKNYMYNIILCYINLNYLSIKIRSLESQKKI